MKKTIVMTLCAVMMLESCGTYTGEGAFVGGEFGAILGSAIGGINGGRRGSDIGTVVGMAGGAIAGAAVGAAADRAEQEKYERHKRDYEQRRAQRAARGDVYNGGGYDSGGGSYSPVDESGFDPNNGGDDRIDFGGAAPSVSQQPSTTVVPRSVDAQSLSVDQLSRLTPGYGYHLTPVIEVRNAVFHDQDGDGILRGGEQCQVSFEIMNNSQETVYDVLPTVLETTQNKHIHISPNIRVESILPNRGVRYTANILADKRIKDGQVVIRVAVAHGQNNLSSQMKEFVVPTRRK